MVDLDTLKKLAEAATPGPWAVTTSDDSRISVWIRAKGVPFVAEAPISIHEFNVGNETAQPRCDLAYIAAMSPDVCLKLIAEIRRLERNQPLGPTALCPVCKTNIGGK